MQISLTILTMAAIYGSVVAYPTHVSGGLVPRDCSPEISAFNLARREQRANLKRSIYPIMKNLTCILAPDSTVDDYIPNPPVRQDITGGQVGIALTMDIGVLDITTCKPLPNVMVEIWSPNALGNYGDTFLRGALPTASNGIAEIQTIFPGYTSDGANHINVMVHTSSSVSSSVAHVGRVFFTDKWTTIIGMQAPYNANTHTRVTNLDDPDYAAAANTGFYPVVDLASIQDDWPEGIVGYITIGVNPRAD